MDPQFDFTRLESNLYIDLLHVFGTTTGIPVSGSTDGQPEWFGATTQAAEDLAIYWLKGSEERTVEILLDHVWPTICRLATLEGEEAEHYDENDEHYHEILGLTDGREGHLEAHCLLRGLSSCAKALAASRADDSYLYAFHATKCEGMLIGASWVRDDQADNRSIREGLAHAGRMSGESRRQNAKARPQSVLELEARLLDAGKRPRDTASIIAARLGVTPEYVRQLRRKGKN